MTRLLSIAAFIGLTCPIRAQTPDSLIQQLKDINAAVTSSPNGAPVTNRAMNIYLSNKIGYYRSQSDDLTLYKNFVLVNAATGTVTVDHSLYHSKGLDERIRAFTTIGIRANAADAFAATYSRRLFNDELGFITKRTWIAKGHTYATAGQKTTMDALRAGILHNLEGEIKRKAAGFEEALTTSDTARRLFNAGLRDEYDYTFALRQSETLIRTQSYQLITLSWTSVGIYVPLITENISVAPALSEPFVTRHGYPLQLNISHTRLWESVRYGRCYLTLAGDLRVNNARDGYQLETLTEPQWAYVGAYSSFITPTIRIVLVCLPPTSHFGLSAHLEQNFGPYHALNGIVGLPIVLVDKKAEPVCNFEFQVRFFDLAGTVQAGRGLSEQAGRGLPGKTSVGLTVGVPFSKIAF